MSKPLALNDPYPTTDGITPDVLSLKIISPAYAGCVSELNAILQYVYHSIYFSKSGFTDYGETLLDIGISEMTHLQLLGKTIYALGAAPIFTLYPPNCYNFYSTKYVANSYSLKNMLEDDIIGEKRAIASYEKMLKSLKNNQVIKIISRIVEDEKLHLQTLEKLLKNFGC